MTDYMIVEIYSRPQQKMLAADYENYRVSAAIAPFFIFRRLAYFFNINRCIHTHSYRNTTYLSLDVVQTSQFPLRLDLIRFYY